MHFTSRPPEPSDTLCFRIKFDIIIKEFIICSLDTALGM